MLMPGVPRMVAAYCVLCPTTPNQMLPHRRGRLQTSLAGAIRQVTLEDKHGMPWWAPFTSKRRRSTKLGHTELDPCAMACIARRRCGQTDGHREAGRRRRSQRPAGRQPSPQSPAGGRGGRPACRRELEGRGDWPGGGRLGVRVECFADWRLSTWWVGG